MTGDPTLASPGRGSLGRLAVLGGAGVLAMVLLAAADASMYGNKAPRGGQTTRASASFVRWSR